MKPCYILAALLAFSFSGIAQDWTGWRGPQRDARYTGGKLLQSWEDNTPKHLWTSAGLGSGYASLCIVGDRIYTTGNTGEGQAVIAVEKNGGKVAWKKELTASDPKHGYKGSRCTPSFDDGLLYVVSSDGQIVCLKAEDGSVVWKKDFKKTWKGKMMSGWGYSESPLIDGDWVLCTPGGPSAMIVALDKKTGKQVWASAVPEKELGGEGKDGAGYSSIMISNAAGVKQYVTLIGRGVIGVRASDGKFLWGYNQVANETANIPTVICEGDQVFASSGYNGGGACLLKLSKDGEGVSAKEVYWYGNTKLQNHHGGFILHEGHIYLGHKHNSGFPTCIDMATGKVRWGGRENRGPGKGSAAVLYADGNVIFRYEDGLLALIEATPEAYKLKGTFKPVFQRGKSWAHPVIVDGLLYLREQDKLMVYDLRS